MMQESAQSMCPTGTVSHHQSRESLSPLRVRSNGAQDVEAVRVGVPAAKERRPPTDAGDGDAVDEVSFPDNGAHMAREEAQRGAGNKTWEAEPCDFYPRFDSEPRWNKFNRFLREGIPFDTPLPNCKDR